MKLPIKPIIAASTSLLLYSNISLAEDLKYHQTPTLSQPQAIAQNLATKENLITKNRFGPVTSKTTKKDLINLYGAQRLKDEIYYGAEGLEKFAATRVNLGQDKSYIVVWKDNKRNQIRFIRVLGNAWKTPEGVGIGTELDELRKKFGEFTFFGFGWDYGGGISGESPISKYQQQSRVTFSLDVDRNAAQKYPNDYRSVTGQQDISSSNPKLKKLGVRVSQLLVLF